MNHADALHPLLKEKLQRIQCVVMDVDGVWTDGGLYLGNDGQEFKKFNVQDGLGISMLRTAGIQTAIITGKQSRIVQIRAEKLKIDYVYQGEDYKLTPWNDLLKKSNLTEDALCYIGDDLLDLPLIHNAGFGAAVANGCEEVKMEADWVTSRPGGSGAIRELCEFILKAQQKWNRAIEQIQNIEIKKEQ